MTGDKFKAPTPQEVEPNIYLTSNGLYYWRDRHSSPKWDDDCRLCTNLGAIVYLPGDKGLQLEGSKQAVIAVTSALAFFRDVGKLIGKASRNHTQLLQGDIEDAS